MGILIESANIIASGIKDLQPGQSTTLHVERYALVQGVVSAFLDYALENLGSALNWKDFSFEADDDQDKPLEEIIPLTVTRNRS